MKINKIFSNFLSLIPVFFSVVVVGMENWVEHERVDYELNSRKTVIDQNNACCITFEELDEDNLFACIRIRRGDICEVYHINTAAQLGKNPFTNQSWDQVDLDRIKKYKQAYDLSLKRSLVKAPSEDEVIDKLLLFFKNNGTLPGGNEDDLVLLERLVTFDHTDKIFWTNNIDLNVEELDQGAWYIRGSSIKDDKDRGYFVRTFARKYIRSKDGQIGMICTYIIYVRGKGYYGAIGPVKLEDYSSWDWESRGSPTLISWLKTCEGFSFPLYRANKVIAIKK